MGFYCIGFNIKLVKNQVCNEDQCSFATSSWVKVSAKRPREKHMLISKESSVRLHFASTSQERPSRKVPAKFSALRILSVTFHIFYPTIYTLITHKSKERLIRENAREVSKTHPPFRERVIHLLVRNHYSLFSFPLPLSYLKRRFVPKHNPHQFRV